MRIECPACHTELLAQTTQCPVCLRPRSRHEMMKDLSKQRHEDESRRRKPYYIVGAIFLGLGVLFVLSNLPKRGPARPPAPAPRPVAPSPAPSPAPEPPSSIQKGSWSAPPPEPAPAPAPKPAPVAATPTDAIPPSIPETVEQEEPAGWRVHGRVYDLLSLKAAAGARLTFENRSTGEVFKAKTDARGNYKVDLPTLTDGGYWVAIAAKGFSGDFLEEGSPPFASRTRAGREEAAAEAAQSKVLHVPIFLDKQAELEYNAALLPGD
jgi:hypothetical protein